MDERYMHHISKSNYHYEKYVYHMAKCWNYAPTAVSPAYAPPVNVPMTPYVPTAVSPAYAPPSGLKGKGDSSSS
ncbi:hypothetical protein PP175_18125 [Aneurinibacillus sp. Ricciae_BoGa-3]|uniref:hypothetical protein n=1 Tax=Aneurinibacillus sp. Ricciae_BoGa-3 TaxID=3022697 RepID=UPI00234053F7|nr:hypothetical protein [Aneurinibacillus sp. Ricciae_BoGa-3]WCK53298.1 hypothetical protein PP175_18125 [Aneurinibacillus sp. Ricciae_BoGa-3]